MAVRRLALKTGICLETFRSALHRSGQSAFTGHVVDLTDLDLRHVVELFIDGVPVRIATAQNYDPVLGREAIGDACYGFSFELEPDALADSRCVEVRLANIGTVVGAPIALNESEDPKQEPIAGGTVEWLGGLRFRGEVAQSENPSTYVNVLIDGEAIVQAPVDKWRHSGSFGHKARALPSFDVHLPARFADGCVRHARFIDSAGEELAGSPVKFAAFEDGLRATIASLGQIETERLRGELFDRLVPMSLPLANHVAWQERFPLPEPKRVDIGPVAVVLVGSGDMQASLATLEQQSFSNWVALVLPLRDGSFEFDPDLLRTFLQTDVPECETVTFVAAGASLDPQMIARFAEAWADFPEAMLIYGDLAVADQSNQSWPIALPAFDYERMLEQGLGATLFSARSRDVGRALESKASNLYRLFNVLAGSPDLASTRIVHIPRSLGTIPDLDLVAATASLAAATKAHLHDLGVDARVTPAKGTLFPAVHVLRLGRRPSVSVIIPIRNGVDLLRRCLTTIEPALEKAQAELIIVDNDSSDRATLDFLEEIGEQGAKVLRVPGPFNFAKLNNRAAEIAEGEVLCLLNNDIEAMDDIWLDEMLSRIVEPDVGAVGALLVWPSGVVQHGGIVLGSSFSAAHAFTDRMVDDPGYGDLLRVAHECSAVTAASLLTSRADYIDAGGLDEISFPVNYNDIDYCLKLRSRGKRIIMTPHARLLHHESASRGKDARPDRAGRFQRELRMLRARWLESLIDDPFYNPILSLDPIPFSALAWPPRPIKARLCQRPKPIDVPSGM